MRVIRPARKATHELCRRQEIPLRIRETRSLANGLQTGLQGLMRLRGKAARKGSVQDRPVEAGRRELPGESRLFPSRVAPIAGKAGDRMKSKEGGVREYSAFPLSGQVVSAGNVERNQNL